jgi:predicted nucleic acid-binding protein
LERTCHALDIGEAAALALAVAQAADLILLDDKAARDAARSTSPTLDLLASC